jgi:hypothetical protein
MAIIFRYECRVDVGRVFGQIKRSFWKKYKTSE